MGFLDQTILFVEDFEFSRKLPFGHPLVPWCGIVIYLTVIYLLSTYMKSVKEPYKLRNFSRMHNVILCIWSAIMFIGSVYHLSYHLYINNSFKYLIIDPELKVYNSLQFWFYIYYLSKYYEMIDTFILILKKKKLIILHVWHHAVMMYFGWLWVDSKWTLVWFGMTWNTFIHVLMYYYYFISTFGIRLWWKKYLTKLQLIQFGTVFLMICYWLGICPNIKNNNWLNYDYLHGDIVCSNNYTKPWVVLISQGVNITFLSLFANFYYQSYTKKKKN